MNTRRDFLRLGALFLPAAVVPRVAYSFLGFASPPGEPLPVATFCGMPFTGPGRIFRIQKYVGQRHVAGKLYDVYEFPLANIQVLVVL
jgi:hypothetical protein